MSDDLPPLPEPMDCSVCRHGAYYTADDIREYARAALTAALAAAWVPCSERMPEPYVVVLVAYELGGERRTGVALREPLGQRDELGERALEWLSLDSTVYFGNPGGGAEPTHWRELPAPPKAGA